MQDQQWRRMRKGTFHQLRAGAERARIVAHHCIHPPRAKPLFVAWTISMDRIVPAVLATGAECVEWSGCWTLS